VDYSIGRSLRKLGRESGSMMVNICLRVVNTPWRIHCCAEGGEWFGDLFVKERRLDLSK